MTDETRQTPAATVSQAMGWRCFHCDEVFTDRAAAVEHFGCSEIETPACKLNAMEGGLLGLVRRQAEQIDAYHREDTASYREFYSLGADHAQALRREEEKGYARGIADARQEPAEMKVELADATRIALGNQLAMMGALHLLMRGYLARDGLAQERLSARIQATRVLTDVVAPPSIGGEQLTAHQRPEG